MSELKQAKLNAVRELIKQMQVMMAKGDKDRPMKKAEVKAEVKKSIDNASKKQDSSEDPIKSDLKSFFKRGSIGESEPEEGALSVIKISSSMPITASKAVKTHSKIGKIARKTR